MRLDKYISPVKNTLFIIVMAGCIEKYETPPSKYDASYLVVDGFLNVSSQSAEVKLSRTLALSVNESFTLETNAHVTIESERGEIFNLIESGNGNYKGSNLQVDPNSKYSLHIITENGSGYRSDNISILTAPSLDSVTWKPGADGITIYANAHDATNSTRYYKWNFTEVWEYTATYFSYFRRVANLAIPRNPEDYNFTCWLTERNTEILIGSTVRLQEDRISEARMTFIPKGALKLGRIYSILVQQQALSEEAYSYWQLLQKNTENLGGLFDPLPSQVLGNMRSEDNLSEPVLGYFNASTIEEKRLFIQFYDLPDNLLVVDSGLTCVREVIPIEKLNTIGNKVLLDPLSPPGGAVSAYTMTTFECGDCRARGGVTSKPDFWIR